jgi:two-component system sensor histidine kinase ChvG
MRWPFRISIRLLAFNLLLVFLPAGGLLLLGTYEQHLLEAQERTMAQEGRLMAAALEARDRLEAADADRILTQLDRRHLARLRVLDKTGAVLVDSASLGPRREPATQETAAPDPREKPIYQVFTLPVRLLRWLRPVAGDSYGEPPPEGLPQPAVRDALAGRYGATTRITPTENGRLVVLHIAIPVRVDGAVAGAVLVSQSTSRILAALVAVRLDVARVFLISLGVAMLLTLLSALTIVRPLGRLQRRAGEILDRRGRLTGGFEITDRRDEIGDLERALASLTERLADHLKASEHLTADLAHEFRNPLASIRAATEVAMDEPDADERTRLLERVSHDVNRLERLLTGAREVSRIDAGLEAEEREPVRLDAILSGLAEAFALRDRGPRVRVHLADATEMVVEASPDRLVQVFENLIGNAVGFSPPDGEVAVHGLRESDVCIVHVDDRGPGIPDEHRGRIFERFFSFRDNGTGGDAHMGLGLAIVRAIVEGYGGTVAAVDRAGGGTRFTVRLPAVESRSRSRSSTPPQSGSNPE